MSLKKIFFYTFFILFILAAALAYFAFQKIYGPNVTTVDDIEFFISDEKSANDVLTSIKNRNILDDDRFLDLIAERMSYSTTEPKPGRYLIKNEMSTYDIINMLRLGKQAALMLTIHEMRTIEDLAGFLGGHLQFDSLHYLSAIKDDPYMALCLYLPDTYEFYWTTNGAQFKERMATYHTKYWRTKKKTLLGLELTPCEIYTLASIVEKETTFADEKPDVAGLYINRLKKGMLLQADPTVIYSVGDFSIRRVLTKYLSADSPYNTYLHTGLPPGPICMPSQSSLRGVLNAKKHDYLYMCAKADNSGTHAFAETLAQHNRNARAFQRWMNERGIKG
jgi:UPF0755 protein